MAPWFELDRISGCTLKQIFWTKCTHLKRFRFNLPAWCFWTKKKYSSSSSCHLKSLQYNIENILRWTNHFFWCICTTNSHFVILIFDAGLFNVTQLNNWSRSKKTSQPLSIFLFCFMLFALFCYLVWLGRYCHRNKKNQQNFAIFKIFSLKRAIISLKMWLSKNSRVNFL